MENEKIEFKFPTNSQVVKRLGESLSKLDSFGGRFLFGNPLRMLRRLVVSPFMMYSLNRVRELHEATIDVVTVPVLEQLAKRIEPVLKPPEFDEFEEEARRIEELVGEIVSRNKHLKANIVRLMMLIDTEGVDEIIDLIDKIYGKVLAARGEEVPEL